MINKLAADDKTVKTPNQKSCETAQCWFIEVEKSTKRNLQYTKISLYSFHICQRRTLIF
jgi:hypothetical protein